jgi:YD repeat-containing protein
MSPSIRHILLMMLWLFGCSFLTAKEIALWSEVQTSQQPSGNTTLYGYYADGRLSGITDAVGGIEYEYDSRGLLEFITETPAGGG